MSGNFTLSSKQNPCCVCGRDKDGDCRMREAENLVLCHTFQDKQDPINGYEWIQHSDKGAGWGVWVAEKPKKASRPEPVKRSEFVYCDRDGNPFLRVTRNGRDFYQSRYENGLWINGLTDETKKQVPIYRYPEIQDAIAEGLQIFWVEGEGVAESLWNLGIPATTTVGGSKGYRNYGNYKDDLKGADLVLCPDRDKLGIEYMQEVAKDFPKAKWCRVYPKSPLWQRLPDNGGLDAVDWIAEGATVVDFASAIAPSLFPEKKEPASRVESDDWDEFQLLVAKVAFEIEQPLEQEFRLRRLCQKYNMPIGFGQQVRRWLTGSTQPFEIQWVEDFLEKKIEDRQWVIASHIPLGSVINICATGGSGKTVLAYDWTKHIVAGLDWNGFRTKQGKVMLVQDDEPELDARDKMDIARFYDLPRRQCAITFKWQFSEIEQLDRFIEKENILVCVIDSLGSTNPGFDRDKPEFSENIKLLRDIASKRGMTFIVLDHTNKGGTQLGTVTVRNAVSELVYLTKPTEDERRLNDLSNEHRILWYDKSRSGLADTKFVLEQQPLTYGYRHLGVLGAVSHGESLTKRIVDFVSQHAEPLTVSKVRNEFGLEYEKTELQLEQLRRTGMLDSEWVLKGSDRYRVYYLKNKGQTSEPAQQQQSTPRWEEF